VSLYDRVLAERAAATKAAGFASLSADQRGALADAWDRWRSRPSWSKRGQNAWYDCPRVKAALGLMPGDKVPGFIKRLKRKDLKEAKRGSAAASKKLSGTWGHPRRHGKKAASKKRRQQGKRLDEGKAASSSQISYAQHLAKQQKLKSPTADEIAAMDDVAISKLIDGLKKKRGEPVFYGNGKFKGWVKKGELWPKGKKESLDEAAWGMFTGGAAPLDVPYHVGGDWKEGAAQLLRREIAKLKGKVTMERARLAFLADALERGDLKTAKRFYKKLSKSARNRYVTVAAREKLAEGAIKKITLVQPSDAEVKALRKEILKLVDSGVSKSGGPGGKPDKPSVRNIKRGSTAPSIEIRRYTPFTPEEGVRIVKLLMSKGYVDALGAVPWPEFLRKPFHHPSIIAGKPASSVSEAVERFRELPLTEYGGIGGRIAGGRHPYRVPPSNTIPPANVIVSPKDMTAELMAKRQRELEQRAETRERMRQLAIECDRRPLKTLRS